MVTSDSKEQALERFIHKNGGGIIYGSESSVSSDSVLDRDSIVEGASFISYGSAITKSPIKNSVISLGEIRESPLIDSHVSAALVYASGLESAVVQGTLERKAVVQNCLLSQKVVVEACTIRNVDIAGPYLIHTDWNHTPRHYLIEPCDGVQMGISECTEGRGHCGCECRPYTEWIHKKELLRKIFVARGWASESIDIIHQLFEQWRQVQLAQAS